MPPQQPRHLLVQTRGEPSPVHEQYVPYGGAFEGAVYEDPDAFTGYVPLDEPGLDLPGELADALRAWSLSRPPEGFASPRELREHSRQGLSTARRLARHLGPAAVLRYADEHHGTSKRVCWGCDRSHWENESPPHPVHLTVEGEFKFGPLRSDGFGDFFPDDPTAALHLSDALVAALRTWADRIDTTLNLDLRDREDGTYDADWQRLFHEGADLARRLAHELGPARTVTYKGLANAGPSRLTSVTWRGARQL